MTVGISDQLSDGTAADFSGTACETGSVTVAENSSVVCAYTATDSDRNATWNKATVTLGSYSVNTGNEGFTYAVTHSGDPELVDVYDDPGDDDAATADAKLADDLAAGASYDENDDASLSKTFTCPTDSSLYVDGVYELHGIGTEYVNEAYLTAFDSTTAFDWDTAKVTVTCYASYVEIKKTTNGNVDQTKDIRFRLYDAAGTDLNDEVSTLNDPDGFLQFQTALVPGDSYTICEAPVPAGYTFEIDVHNGGNVLTYAGPPGAVDPTGEIQCFDFVAADSPTTLLFYVNNSYPGGAPRTPGYWKNWSTCSGGNQAETAAKLGGVAANVFLLDDLLPQTVGNLTVGELDCQVGVYVLDARWAVDANDPKEKGDAGKQASNDAAYELARNYLAARLNQDAGACDPEDWTWDTRAGENQTFEQVLTEAQNFLVSIDYDGAGDLLVPKNKQAKEDRAYALFLAGIIDDYNNSELCEGTPSH
jgi:hypothetical protein